MYGTDWRYANTRLADTVVRHHDDLYKVLDVNDSCEAIGFYVKDDAEVIHRVPIDELNVKPITLGYVNYKGSAQYVVRIPKRQDWRQGLRYQNMTVIGGGSVKHIRYSTLGQPMNNLYPSIANALLRLRDSSSVAWSRTFAISNGYDGKVIHYKGNKQVGKFIGDQPVLDERYSYLNQALEESLCVRS